MTKAWHLKHVAFALLAPLVPFAAVSAAAQDADGHREAGAHVHGAVDLALVLDGQKLSIELSSPLWNLVGFEHTPSTAEEKAAWRAAQSTLKDPTKIVALPAAAGCNLAGQSLGPFETADPAARPAAKTNAAHGEHPHEKKKPEHQSNGRDDDFHDALLGWSLTCSRPGSLSSVNLVALRTFPKITKATAVAIVGSKQAAETLTAGSPTIRFP